MPLSVAALFSLVLTSSAPANRRHAGRAAALLRRLMKVPELAFERALGMSPAALAEYAEAAAKTHAALQATAWTASTRVQFHSRIKFPWKAERTSVAAPFVMGAIALAWSEFPAATAAQLRWAFTYAHAGRRSTVRPTMSAKRDSQPTSTEPTFYPVTKTLLSAILKEGRLPFEVRVNTSETKGKAHDMPDFVLGDDKMFVGVYGEVKRANVLLEDLALSTEQNDQIGRYLAFFVFAAFSLVVDLRVSAMLVSNWHLIVSWRNGDPA